MNDDKEKSTTSALSRSDLVEAFLLGIEEMGYTEKLEQVIALVRVYREAIAKLEDIKVLVDRFLKWPLPKSVCSDLCVTDNAYPHQRIGTNLLTAHEAGQMLEFVLQETRAAEKKAQEIINPKG